MTKASAIAGQYSFADRRSVLSHTTPFPNLLLDEAMPALKDTQWRLLCVIVRQTLGWHDKTTNQRKQRDWLTRAQLQARTGRQAEAVSLAIDALVRQGYIVAQNREGQVLAAPADRRKAQGRIYYSLASRWHSDLLQQESSVTNSRIPDNRFSDNRFFRHRKTERQIGKVSSESRVFGGKQRKSELANTGKADTTKQTLTKERETKESQAKENNEQEASGTLGGRTLPAPDMQRINGADQISAANTNSPLPRLAKEVFTSESRPQPQQTLLPEYSEPARTFIAAFEQLAAKHLEHRDGKPDTALSAVEARQLEHLLARHQPLDWTPFLEMFFESDLRYIATRHHSLAAFLGTCNFFLVRKPGLFDKDRLKRLMTLSARPADPL